MYCGNNANVNIPRGTRYQCLKKGIGVGKNLPLDKDYGIPYAPIVNRGVYCGNDAVLPPNYLIFGAPSECLQIGVGIGKQMRYAKRYWGEMWTFVLFFIVTFLIVLLSSFVRNTITKEWLKKELWKWVLIALAVAVGITGTLFAFRWYIWY